MNRQLLDAIVANGTRYVERYLSAYEPTTLERDWWRAFDFFLVHACFQGRRDEVSKLVYQAALDVLTPIFSGSEQENNFSEHLTDQWNQIGRQLRDRIGAGKVGKDGDVKMIISALSHIATLPSKNIVAHSVERIRASELQSHYKELQARNGAAGIFQVGPKIAAFYLRDVVSLFQLTDCVDRDSAFCLQAVDTWVRKVVGKLGIIEARAAESEIQRAIVEMCDTEGVSAFRFNQGAWFTGYHAFELFLEILSNQGSSEQRH